MRIMRKNEKYMIINKSLKWRKERKEKRIK